MSTKILQEALKTNPSALIELFKAEIAENNGNTAQTLFFYNGSTYDYQNLVWNSQVYTAFPIEITGFEWDGSGKLPTPKMTGSNIGGFLSALNLMYDDLLGTRITRIKTFLKYLDAVNFENDTNAEADPTAEFPKEIYYVDRKVVENANICEYELVSALDLSNSKLPRRTITQNICMWKYKGEDGYCGYNGTAYFDEYGNPTIIGNDKCGKRLSDCEKRFNTTTRILRFGGFPGAGLMR